MGREVVKYQGGLYFVPEAVVGLSALCSTDRTSTSPTLGVACWLDFEDPQTAPTDARTRVRGVAWTYPDPQPGHDLIRGRYGFHPGNRGATRQTVERE
jgi:uncharacterized protein (DUF427 family)